LGDAEFKVKDISSKAYFLSDLLTISDEEPQQQYMAWVALTIRTAEILFMRMETVQKRN
jgi:hypothetical protein